MATESADAGANLSSIAVLPFADRSATGSDTHLGDGIAETLISALAKVPELEVAARTSAFSFRGREGDLAEVGRKLGVATVLEGSVQRAGDRIRVTSELVNVSTGRTMWSQTFDRGAAEIFAVQDDVAREVIAALKGRLLAEQTAVHTGNATRDPEAYDLYLTGRFLWNRRNTADLTKAIELFESAISRDRRSHWRGSASPTPGSPGRSGAVTQRRHCRALAPLPSAPWRSTRLGEATLTLAYLLMVQDWNWSASDSVFRRRRRAQSAIRHRVEVVRRSVRGSRAQRGVAGHDSRARDLDPLSPIIYYNLGYSHEVRGPRDEALASFEKALELDRPARGPRLCIARVPRARRHGEVFRGASRGSTRCRDRRCTGGRVAPRIRERRTEASWRARAGRGEHAGSAASSVPCGTHASARTMPR